MERGSASNGDIIDSLASNLNAGRKRYRKTADDIQFVPLSRPLDQIQFLQNVHVTRVACNELGRPVTKQGRESFIPDDGQSNLAGHQ